MQFLLNFVLSSIILLTCFLVYIVIKYTFFFYNRYKRIYNIKWFNLLMKMRLLKLSCYLGVFSIMTSYLVYKLDNDPDLFYNFEDRDIMINRVPNIHRLIHEHNYFLIYIYLLYMKKRKKGEF